jgi:hypothetical protein
LGGRNFTRIVEVFPPSFNLETKGEPLIGLKQKSRDFLERVRRIQNLADAILIADVKDVTRLKLSTIHSAAFLRDELGVEAVPVITARDSNRSATRSAILTAFAKGLDTIMLVWGDRYPDDGSIANVYDYRNLAELIGEAASLASRSGIDATFLAPVDLSRINSAKGSNLAKERLAKGASSLLAQPPTTDSFSTLGSHLQVLKKQALRSKVLLNVFPFRSKDDVVSCRKKFGWNLPDELDLLADRGETELLKEARRVAVGIANSGSSGVYVSTRGRPEVARYILD